jgi:hypothetical protein
MPDRRSSACPSRRSWRESEAHQQLALGDSRVRKRIRGSRGLGRCRRNRGRSAPQRLTSPDRFPRLGSATHAGRVRTGSCPLRTIDAADGRIDPSAARRRRLTAQPPRSNPITSRIQTSPSCCWVGVQASSRKRRSATAALRLHTARVSTAHHPTSPRARRSGGRVISNPFPSRGRSRDSNSDRDQQTRERGLLLRLS